MSSPLSVAGTPPNILAGWVGRDAAFIFNYGPANTSLSQVTLYSMQNRRAQELLLCDITERKCSFYNAAHLSVLRAWFDEQPPTVQGLCGMTIRCNTRILRWVHKRMGSLQNTGINRSMYLLQFLIYFFLRLCMPFISIHVGKPVNICAYDLWRYLTKLEKQDITQHTV